jgi:hypothetical protein
MRSRNLALAILTSLILSPICLSQTTAESGFVISLKNGSMVRGRTLSRDEAGGGWRLTMTSAGDGTPKSYAIIAADDADSIKASSTDTDSITIKLIGGSELRCKEFGLNGDTVSVKLGSASSVDVKWEQIESISFSQ